MSVTLIHRLLPTAGVSGGRARTLFGRSRRGWDRPGHLSVMDHERILALGLEPMLTTSELADYLGVNVQALYDLRAQKRGPRGVRVGREIHYRTSDVREWLDNLRESGDGEGGEL
jgi:excisionase family DNA binding protein